MAIQESAPERKPVRHRKPKSETSNVEQKQTAPVQATQTENTPLVDIKNGQRIGIAIDVLKENLIIFEEPAAEVAEKVIVKLEEQRVFVDKQEKREEVRRVSRRKILFWAVGGAAALALGKSIFDGTFSEEAQQQRKAKQLEEKKKFESEHVLSAKPSSPSYANWRVSRIDDEEEKNFTESSSSRAITVVNKNNYILIPKTNDQKKLPGTDITISDYVDSEGISMPQLNVFVGPYYRSEANKWEKWIFKNGSIIKFEDTEDRQTKFFKIEKTATEAAAFRFILMEKTSM